MIQRSSESPLNLTDAVLASDRSASRSSQEFFAGEENRLLLAVTENWLPQAEIYNPLLLVGETGVGKSRFAGLLVELFRAEHRDSSIMVLPGSDFAHSYADAMKADATNDFHTRYDRLDLLVLDNLEELRGHDAAQQALRQVTDKLLARGARLIVVSRIVPRADRRIMPSLASRLGSGLVVPVVPPAETTRREILRAAAERQQVTFTEQALNLLASLLSAPPPVLAHAVMQLAAEAEDANKPIEVEAAEQFALHEQGIRRPTLAKITTLVARRFALKSADLKGKSRRRLLVQARGVAMLLARQLAATSYQKIGDHFGNRDHSTVMHACRQTEVLVLTDDNTRFAYEELSQKLKVG